MIYVTPKEYYFRLHFVRSRFKNDVENVLLYFSNEVSKLEKQSIITFNTKLFNAIQLYTGNAIKKPKTIDNWRTEISTLFGFVEEDSAAKLAKPGNVALKLATDQDLVQFFKYFLFYFQYPGGHIKPKRIKDVIDNNIRFKPAQYFLKVLAAGEKITAKRFHLNKAEATHFIYNDLRATRDNDSPDNIVDRILKFRKSSHELDFTGDVTRYARDILDYMVLADLLVLYGSNYFIKWDDRETVIAFMESSTWFNGYEGLYNSDYDIQVLNPIKDLWLAYVNRVLENDIFKTDVLKYLGVDENSYTVLIKNAIQDINIQFDPDNVSNTKEIGDFGENLILGHESMRLKQYGRSDLLHLIKLMPTHLALGYDIQSIETDSKKRYIEVKTTISMKPVNFYKFHLTTNEWATAETLKDAYFVYRLMISKHEQKLFILQNPVAKYKKDIISMRPKNGAEIVFKENSGEWSDLLIWEQ